MQLNRDWIAAHIPHQGQMCLLEEVVEWNARRICCRSGTHRAADNPLRAYGRLGVACGIEYAAQAMAVHGALLGSSALAPGTRAGYLASVRDVLTHVTQLDDIAADLIATAELLAADGSASLYRFTITAAGFELLSGRATIAVATGDAPAVVHGRRE